MKQCPQCGQVYTDENLNFCLTDGVPLNPSDSQATVVVPQPLPQPKKKGRTMLWVGLVVLVMLAGIIGFAGLLMFMYSGSAETPNVNQKSGSPSPKTSATPKPSPSPSPTASSSPETSPTTGTAKPSPQTSEVEEVTPISWNTSASTFKGNPGQIYKFQCPPKGTAGPVWGSDVYTQDSSICTAAVHAGVITLEKGGLVTVEYRPGRSIYGSTERNGITSNPFGEYPQSFVVR